MLLLDLKQPLKLGGAPNLQGELLSLRLIEFEDQLIKPWLPPELNVGFAPISFHARFFGDAEGAIELRFDQPLQVKQFQIEQSGSPLISELNLSTQPSLTAHADQNVDFTLSKLRVRDPKGILLSGNLGGHIDAGTGQGPQPLEGMLAEADLQINLERLGNSRHLPVNLLVEGQAGPAPVWMARRPCHFSCRQN